MIAATIDTNILVISVISEKGSPRRILELWMEGRFTLVTSPEIIAEVERVLRYPRIQCRYKLQESDILAFLHLLSVAATIVYPEPLSLKGLPDPADEKLFGAIAGGASYLVTGDRALLELREYRNVKTLSASEFVDVFEKI